MLSLRALGIAVLATLIAAAGVFITALGDGDGNTPSAISASPTPTSTPG
jgi:hypothetical protein